MALEALSVQLGVRAFAGARSIPLGPSIFFGQRFMRTTVEVSRRWLHGALSRTAVCFAFWVTLAGFDPVDLPVGIFAAVIATSISLRLLPPGQWSLRPAALLQLVFGFLHQSVGAGIDVARRAFDPRLPLRPGFVDFQTRLSPGPARNLFCTMSSLLPGTLPVGEVHGKLTYHCLDIEQPVVSQLGSEETALLRALGHD